MVRLGGVESGAVRQVSSGEVCRGMLRFGKVRQVRQVGRGRVRCGGVGSGDAGKAALGVMRCGFVRSGYAG